MKPPLIGIPTGCVLAGLSLPTGYRLAKSWPLFPVGGQKRIVLSEFERMLGRVFTEEEIADATARAKVLTYTPPRKPKARVEQAA